VQLGHGRRCLGAASPAGVDPLPAIAQNVKSNVDCLPRQMLAPDSNQLVKPPQQRLLTAAKFAD
jgi:hypothetical protein